MTNRRQRRTNAEETQRAGVGLKARTQGQKALLSALEHSVLTFAVGPAGTGKTYIASRFAAQRLLAGDVKRIIVTRPAVEAGESLGFLPGELGEKFAPWFGPVRGELEECLGPGHVTGMMKSGRLVAMPLAYMRGVTFRDAVVILDEAQNATNAQFRLFLTRIGENCRVIVDGDPSQRDVKSSGLTSAVDRCRGIPGVSVVQFTRDDIVRSGIVRMIAESYELA